MTTRRSTMTTTTRCRSTTATPSSSPTKSNASFATTVVIPDRSDDRDVQYRHTAGVIDLTWGHPDPSSLATDAVAEATDAVLAVEGWKALTYGASAGAMSVREAIAEHDSAVDHPIAA